MPRGVILDIDGTLVDSNYQHVLAWQAAFADHEITLPAWAIHRHIGMGGDQLVKALAGERAEREHGDALRAAHDERFMAAIESVAALDGARELLIELEESGVPVVLASSAAAAEVDHYLDLLGARELVRAWTTSADVERTKPEPDLVHAALEKLGDRDALMVGDTVWDVRSAARAGLDTVAVLTGGVSRSELAEAGAIAVHESVDRLRGGALAPGRVS